MERLTLGTTFSQLQCKYLQLDHTKALSEIVKLPFHTIRVCAYWNEIENKKNEYDYRTIDRVIEEVVNANKKIILAVGMKAPRWPEFHLPQWAKDEAQSEKVYEQCSKFTRNILQRYRDIPNITHLQIENEPLNKMPITENKAVDKDFLCNQVNEARSLKRPDQKILATTAINIFPYSLGFKYNSAFEFCVSIADAIGVNVYTKIGTPVGYIQPFPFFWWKLAQWQQEAQQSHTETWITEAQSEPWEHGSAVHTSKAVFPSASPERTEKLVDKLSQLGYKNILLWGCEYWYWQKQNGRSEWWNAMSTLLEKHHH